jgi:hypothetical protein
VIEVLGREAFLSDVLTDRRPGRPHVRHGYLQQAPGADGGRRPRRHRLLLDLRQLAVRERRDDLRRGSADEQLLIARNIHKSVISGLLLAGIEPVWVEPVWDLELEIATRRPSRPSSARWTSTRREGAAHAGPTDYGVRATWRPSSRRATGAGSR